MQSRPFLLLALDALCRSSILKQKIAIPILGTRGCPYSCFNYCTYPLQQGRKVRARSVKNIIDEIKYWQSTLGAKKFVFRDPVFSINRKHTIELCNEMIKQKICFKNEGFSGNQTASVIAFLARKEILGLKKTQKIWPKELQLISR